MSKGTNEPYRVFTSRAEYRLLLREDNAIFRLGGYAYRLGLMEEEDYRALSRDEEDIKRGMEVLKSKVFTPSKDTLAMLASLGEEPIGDKCFGVLLAGRDSFGVEKLEALDSMFGEFSPRAKEQIKILAKYDAYIQKQTESIDKMEDILSVKIPEDFVFDGVAGLSLEVVEKLNKFRPPTLFHASRISGITPASLDVLHLYIHLHHKKRSKECAQ